jgi:hypothetical protein
MTDVQTGPNDLEPVRRRSFQDREVCDEVCLDIFWTRFGQVDVQSYRSCKNEKYLIKYLINYRFQDQIDGLDFGPEIPRAHTRTRTRVYAGELGFEVQSPNVHMFESLS